MTIGTKRLGTFDWSTKPVISSRWFAGAGISLSALYFIMRLLPYLSRHEQTLAYTGKNSVGESASSAEREKMRQSIAGHTLSKDPLSLTSKGLLSSLNTTNRPSTFGSSGESHRSGVSSHLVERPLLDGMSVALSAVLLRHWASNEGDATIEAKIVNAAGSQSSSQVDLEAVEGSILIGQAQGNAETHRVEIHFTELRTPDGKRNAITGAALSTDGKTFGISAQYSSGSAPRILGAAIGEVITTADSIATSRVLQNTSDDTIALRETHQLISRTSGQAGSELSQEATKDLKSTRAVLSVEAGTAFLVKLQSAGSTRGAP